MSVPRTTNTMVRNKASRPATPSTMPRYKVSAFCRSSYSSGCHNSNAARAPSARASSAAKVRVWPGSSDNANRSAPVAASFSSPKPRLGVTAATRSPPRSGARRPEPGRRKWGATSTRSTRSLEGLVSANTAQRPEGEGLSVRISRRCVAPSASGTVSMMTLSAPSRRSVTGRRSSAMSSGPTSTASSALATGARSSVRSTGSHRSARIVVRVTPETPAPLLARLPNRSATVSHRQRFGGNPFRSPRTGRYRG